MNVDKIYAKLRHSFFKLFIMNFKLMNKIILGTLFAVALLLSSCEDNPVVIDTENLETSFKLVVNEQVLETDAFAATCEVDGKEGFMIANKIENLSFPLQTQNFEAGDFVYITTKDGGEVTWGYGGQALGEDVTGFTGFLSILFSDAELRVSINDGNVVVGTSEGVLYGFDPSSSDPDNPDFVEFPYTATFIADIVEESDLCDL